MYNNNNQQSPESLPFAEWGEKPGGYVVTPIDDTEGTRKLTSEDNIIVAACVLLNGSITAQEYKVGLECQLRTAPDGLSETAAPAMMNAYSKTVNGLSEEPLNSGLQNFKAKTLQEQGTEQLKNNHNLIGGLVLYGSQDGYKAGLFIL